MIRRMYFDKRLEQWYPEDTSEEIIAYCDECGMQILENEEYLTDGKHYWCDKDCLYDYYEIKEVD